MVLPIFRPISMKQHFSSKERYIQLERLLFSQIAMQLDQDPTEFRVDDSLPFLAAYLNDLANAVIDYRTKSSTKIAISSHLHGVVSELMLLAVTSVPLHGRELDSSLLVDALITNSHFRHEALTEALDMALTSSKATEILATTQNTVQSSFGSRKSPTETLSLLNRTTFIIALILDSKNEQILDAFTSPNSQFLGFLEQIYDVMLPSIFKSLPDLAESTNWRSSWFHTKISILDSLHAALSFLSRADSWSHACDILFSFTNKGPPTGKATVLVDATLLMDYEKLFKFSSNMPNSNLEQRVGVLKSILESYDRNTLVEQPMIRQLIPPIASTPTDHTNSASLTSDIKGKCVALHEDEDESATEVAILQVLDVLPDQEPQFLRRCLAHPKFKGEGGTERLIASLLEGSIPFELSADTTDAAPSNAADVGLEAVNNRRNVFDDQMIDLSSLRLGKKRDDADGLLQDKTWLQEMKADILRRAVAHSDDEEEPSRYARRKQFIEDMDDEFEDLDDAAGSVHVIGDGETTDGDDDSENSLEAVLELAYLENPKLFDRDSATRKSEARAKLIARTGWSHEQLEGWRIMLDRNPRKLQILQKHEFRGNRSLAPISAVTNDKPEKDEQRKDTPRGRGGGGRGRGRGRGAPQTGAEGSKADAARERAWKERSGNRQRQKGHDKKFTRGEPPQT